MLQKKKTPIENLNIYATSMLYHNNFKLSIEIHQSLCGKCAVQFNTINT